MSTFIFTIRVRFRLSRAYLRPIGKEKKDYRTEFFRAWAVLACPTTVTNKSPLKHISPCWNPRSVESPTAFPPPISLINLKISFTQEFQFRLSGEWASVSLAADSSHNIISPPITKWKRAPKWTNTRPWAGGLTRQSLASFFSVCLVTESWRQIAHAAAWLHTDTGPLFSASNSSIRRLLTDFLVLLIFYLFFLFLAFAP
jgi:hypothetical protein